MRRWRPSSAPRGATPASPADGVDAFVSYARVDVQRVLPVIAGIRQRQRLAWFDAVDIPAGATWREELRRGIEGAKSVICFITPAWIASVECRAEVDLAISLGKRLIPVVLSPVAMETLPGELRAVQWIDATHGDGDAIAAATIAAIDVEPDRVRDHTYWLLQALRWDAAGRPRTQLVRGRGLRAAETWVQHARHDPEPTALQIAFVTASRRAERRRARQQLALAVVAVLVTSTLAVIAVQQRNTAIRQRNTARSRGLAVASGQQLARDPELALLLARAAWQSAHTSEALSALRAAVHGSLVRTTIHTGSSTVSAVSGTGSVLVTGSVSGQMTSWDATSGRQLAAHQMPGAVSALLPDHADQWGVALTQNHQAASYQVGSDGRLTVGAAIADVSTAAISGDGRTAAFGLAGGSVERAVDHTSPTPVAAVGADEQPRSLALSGDGSVLAVGTGLRDYQSQLPTAARIEGRVYLQDGSRLRLLRTYLTPVTTLALDDSGRFLLSVAADGSGAVQQVSSGRVVLVIRNALFAALDPTGRHAVISTLEGETTLGTVATGRWQTIAARSVPLLDLGFGPGGAVVVAASSGGGGYVWSAASGAPIAQLLGSSGPMSAIAMQTTGTDVVTGNVGGDVQVWQVPSPIPPVSLGSPNANQTVGISIHSVSVSPDGALILTSADNGGVQTTDAHGAKVCLAGGQLSDNGNCPLNLAAVYQLPGIGLDARAAFSPDGHAVAVLASDGAVAILATTRVPRLLAHTAADGSAATSGVLSYSPGGALLLAQRGPRPPRLIDPATGHVVAVLTVPASQSYSAAWLSSSQLAIIDESGDVDTYDAHGRHLRHLAQIGGTPFALAATPDGRTIAVAADNRVVLLDAATGTVKLTFDEDTGDVDALAITADGAYVLSGSLDGTARLWDIATGTTVSTLSIPGAQFVAVAFDDVTRTVIAGGQNSTLYFDPCDVCIAPAALAAEAARHSTRPFTPAERQQFGVGTLVSS